MELTATICGISTPIGEGGIGIIRISGPDTVAICNQIFRKNKTSQHTDYLKNYWNKRTDSRNFIHGYIFDPFENYIIDEVLVALMRKPLTYTKEDIIEIHSHSGPVILKNLLQLLNTLGARLAEPGEFTKRAFLNGRIDLAQAEAVIDLIQAKNTQALKMANASLSGEFSRHISTARTILLDTVAEIQATLEFPEDVSEDIESESWSHSIDSVLTNQLLPILDNYDATERVRNGFKVGILGRPNVGKSSLLNALLRKERAIVTDIPGTTRDVIEDRVTIDGVDIFLYDTAGIRSSTDSIEQIGVKKSLEVKSNCDLVLFMVDVRQPFCADDLTIQRELKDVPVIYLINKVDLVEDEQIAQLLANLEYTPVLSISAKTGSGVTSVKNKLFQFAQANVDRNNHRCIVPNLRQSELLKEICATLKAVQEAFGHNTPEDIIVIELERAAAMLGKMIGENIESDVLDRIFKNFCIGK